MVVGPDAFSHDGSTPTCFDQEADIVWNGVNTDQWGRNEIHGSETDDVIIGTSGDDVIIGHGGSDIICGGNGNDWIYGDDRHFDDPSGGSDVINGGTGDDVLFGGADFDVIHGSTGEDALLGGWGPDLLHGGDNADFLVGMWGADTHYGEGGNDTMNAITFDDALAGDESIGGLGFDYCHVHEDEALFHTFCDTVTPH
jgi:Ca2+-binding RTX toxin-like protein